ncbi:Multidrug resistance-associated protein 1 [Coemansia sp. S3946]|nr:Multidrug resistance-associated protein 1 [Coemansia sp. S3946]
MQDISFAQVRYYNALQKLRELTLDDLWPVPKRFQLRNAYAELAINTNESLFLIRAIIRMVWKPMIPIHVAGMLFKLLPIMKTMLNGYIYHCLDSSVTTVYYKAYMAAVGIILIELLDMQKKHLTEYIDKEKARVKNVLELELVRKPLMQSGLKRIPSKWDFRIVQSMVNDVQDLQDIIPYVFGTLATVLPIYRQVGWYAFIPLLVASSVNMFDWTLQRLMGSETFNTIVHTRLGDLKQVPSITINNCSFRWEKKAALLKQVTLNAAAGELVAVVGKTGSGKTSLLLAMCRELEMTKGSGAVVGRIGYMEQSPWIMNDTMRANILFGREFDEEYYWKVIHACALTRDLESWPDSDMTMIGERGVNISGGQRARLALARTVYSQADVYMLDDPLSAVDAHVKRHILDNVILSSGLLRNKLRIITTHSESMLPFCNQVITVDDKTTSVVYQEPKERQYIAPVAAVEIDDVCESNSFETDTDSSTIALTTDADPQATISDETSSKCSEADEDQLPQQKRTLLDNAKYVFRLCGWHVIATTIVPAIFKPIASFILEGYNIAALKENAKSNIVSHDAVLWYLKVCLLKTATSEILLLIERYVGDMFSEEKLEVDIQNDFVRSLIHAPLSLIERVDRYDIESVHDDGSSTMAYGIPRYLCSETANAITSVLTIWRSAQATPQLIIIVPLVVWARTVVRRFTSPALGSLRRMSREVSSKHSQTESIINGGGLMIRMFGVESHYMSRYTSDKDEEAKITQPTKSASLLSEMATISISFAGNFLTTCSAITQSHLTKHKASSGQLRLFQDDVDCMIHNVGRLVKIPSRLQRFSEDVGMFRQYADLEPEGPYIVEDCRVPGEWPSSGNVEFKNLSVKYGASLDYALKNLNFTARPGEKIGIVGRTGAGKSTLAKAIFRLLNKNVEGSIEIDGHDTAKFGVGDFRPKLGIIPQESAMFSGTVKRNLDPLYEFTIEDIWAAMIKCGVAELIDPNRKHKPARLTSQTSIASSNNNGNTAVESEIEDKEEDEEAKSIRLRWENSGLMMRVLLLLFAKRPEIEDSITPATGINKYLIQGGEGFSNGQKQLFSLCRVIMRKHKVLILDEATADVDQETDRKMQELIRSEFSNSTVLTIAHRLDTIMNSDRIIVMDKGEIVEMGPPQVLIANGGKFAELVQANEF